MGYIVLVLVKDYIMGCLWNINGIVFWDIYIIYIHIYGIVMGYSWARMGYSRF